MKFTFEDAHGKPDIFHATSLGVAIQYARRHGLRIVCDELLPLIKPQAIQPEAIIVITEKAA